MPPWAPNFWRALPSRPAPRWRVCASVAVATDAAWVQAYLLGKRRADRAAPVAIFIRVFGAHSLRFSMHISIESLDLKALPAIVFAVVPHAGPAALCCRR